jgi:hypothetical protein
LRPLLNGRETDTCRFESAARRPFLCAPIAPGDRVVNARGVPGTIGFLAITRHDQHVVLVTAHHVLFGNDSRPGEAVFGSVGQSCSELRYIGLSLYGRMGPNRADSAGTYVDCAAASIAVAGIDEFTTSLNPQSTAPTVSVGHCVTKCGAATGITQGEVVAVDHASRRVRHSHAGVHGQLLIRSCVSGLPFSADGDSGAALHNDHGELVGLLWGITGPGESLACPIAPVLHVLNVVPAIMTHLPMRSR